MRNRFCVLLACACVVLGMSAWPAAAGTAAATAAAASASAQQVTYLGHTFTVPASWPVVNLAARPTACVRFDLHAIYLGTPSASQQCPANVIGKTEAILVEPAGATPAGAPASDAVSHDIVATAPGIRVHATYGSDRAAVTAILSAAGITHDVPAAATRAPAAAGATPAAAPTVSATSTNFHGKGFDACSAPSSGTMSAWRSSPYAAIGIYIGGADRACAQPSLTSGWVSQQAAAGWHFIPLWVGPEAEFGQITSPASQGTANAQDAAGEAASLGFGRGSVLYYDMEGYPSSQSSNALGFESAWTKELHALGYMSGVYSSDSSGIAGLVNHKSSYTMPDVIDDADWNGEANTSLPSVPAGDWPNHQRIHQYSGGANETYRGVTINIDQDYLDVAVAPTVPQAIGHLASVVDSSLGDSVDLFGIGTNGTAFEKTWKPASGWSAWQNLGGVFTGSLTAVADPTLGKSVDLFGIGTNGTAFEKTWKPASGWSAWQNLGGVFAGSLTPVVDATMGKSVDLFGTGTTGTAFEAYWTPSSGWSAWSNLGGTFSAPLTAVADPTLGKSVDVFGIGTTGTPFEKTWSLASGWSGWQNLGGVLTGSLDAVADPALGQSVDLFGTGTNGVAFEKTWKPASGWSAWQNMGGTFGQSFAAVADPTLGQSVDAFGVGRAGTAFGAGWKPATGWASWSNMGGVFSAGLTGVADPTLGKSVDVFGVGTTGTAFEKTWKPGTGWSAWQNLGGTFTG